MSAAEASPPTTAQLLAENALLRGETATTAFQVEVLQERLAELEFAIEDAWYARIGSEFDAEFSRGGLRRIIRIALITFLKNPMVKRAVDVQAHYVWGQGVSFRANDEDVQDCIDAFLDDPKNQSAFTGLQAQIRLETNLTITGNVFGVLFVEPKTGQVQVRTVDVDEIEDIISNPEDANDVWFYKRLWTSRTLDAATGKLEDRQHTAFYPDWGFEPAKGQQFATIGGYPVNWNAPMFHVSVGGARHQRFGIPEIYAALDWAIAYNKVLEDDATRSSALARFVWKFTTDGGAPGIAAAKSKLATTLANNGNAAESNPPPVAGSTAFTLKNHTDMQPFDIRGGVLPPDHARGIFLQLVAALGLPETFFGEVAKGAHATAKTMDRPTQLKMATRQRLWADLYQRLLQWVIDRSIEAPQGILRGKNGMAQTRTGVTLSIVTDSTGEEELDRYIDISFPPILEQDVTEQVNAIVAAATLAGNPAAGTLPSAVVTSELASALGLEDTDEIVAQMEEERTQQQQSELAQTKAQLATLQQQHAAAQRQGQPAAPGQPRGTAQPTSPQGQAEPQQEAGIARVLADLAADVRRIAG